MVFLSCSLFVCNHGGGGGIRTPVPVKANGFQDRLVMTASIRLRSLDIIYYNTANVKSIKLVAVDYLAEIDGVKIFFAVHLLLESFV